MSGSLTFQPNTTHNTNNQWPLVVAKNYDNMDSIFQAMPHLKLINTPIEINPELKVTGLVIRSANDDNVHKVLLQLYRPLNMEYGQQLLEIEEKLSSFGKERSIAISILIYFLVQ